MTTAAAAHEPVFVDTNVLVYAAVPAFPLHVDAKAKLRELEADAAPLWISRQILREYLSALSRPSNMSNRTIEILVTIRAIPFFGKPAQASSVCAILMSESFRFAPKVRAVFGSTVARKLDTRSEFIPTRSASEDRCKSLRRNGMTLAGASGWYGAPAAEWFPRCQPNLAASRLGRSPMGQPHARWRSMVSGSWADTEWRDDRLLSRSPARAAYTGGHPLEKRPKSLTLSHFSARPAWPPGGKARSASSFMPGRSDLTSRLPSEQNTMWDVDPQKSHIDVR
jgi:predicted nucleic acid-binding protein